MLATIGACIIALGGVVFLINVFVSRKRGQIAGDDPWDGDTLEWAAASPPANYNFEYLPVASSRSPMWVPREERMVVTGLRNDRREVLVTTLMDAEPHHRLVLPAPSIWPFLAAVAVSIGFAGSVFNAWYITWGTILAAIAFVGWFWPRRPVELEP